MAELALAIIPTVDLCLKYIKEARELCFTLKHAKPEVSTRFLRLANNWVKYESQLNFFKRIHHVMQDEHREVYGQTLKVLQNKLEVVLSVLKSFIKLQPENKDEIPSSKYKVSAWKFAAKKKSLDESIKDLETWQGLADQSWFLLLRIADTQVDQDLATSGGVSEPSTNTPISAAIAIRAGLQQADNLPQEISVVAKLTLNSNELKKMNVHAIPFCDGIKVATNTHSDGTASRYILNHIQCDLGERPQTLKRNVRDLVRKLQVDDPYTFGLLKCKGIVEESVSARHGEHLSFTIAFKEPPASQNPRSLRDILLNTPTTTSNSRRLEIARDLAKSIGYVHTFGFVHKNVRPESVLIFDHVHGMSAFLVGFENFRRDEGNTERQGDDAQDKNLYRHPSRQGPNPRDNYEMRHDIYSLGVCLLEIGLWGSFVEYDPNTASRSLSHLLTTQSVKGKEIASTPLQGQAENRFTALIRDHLPGSMGDRYTDIVKTCLTCLDPDNMDFGDDKGLEDEDGILIGARYIEKVSFRLGKLTM